MTEKTLQDRLLGSAARFARSGLKAFLDKDLPIFFLHSGTALEQLSKAYLASVHSSLIAASDFDSLLHACDQSRHAKKRLRTINVRDALDRAGQMIPALANLKESLGFLVAVRNGVVHVGELESQAVDEVLVPYMRASDHLLAALPEGDRVSYWGDLLDVVDVRLSEWAVEAERRAVDAIAAAKVVFEERFGKMEDGAREAVLLSIEGAYDPAKYDEGLVSCPACSRLALVQGSFDVDWEADWDVGDFGEPYLLGAFPTITFSPGKLECRICGLTLEGEEELTASAIPASWKLEDVDPSDLYEREYDWDDY